MKTIKFNDFFIKNEKNSQKIAKNEQKIVKNRKKLIKDYIFKAIIVTLFLIVFGADAIRIVVAFFSLIISGLLSMLNIH